MRWLLVAMAAVLAALILIPLGGIGVSLVLENQDVFCAACHTEPEATYYQQTTQLRAVTLAAFHKQKQTVCIDCHSGGGIFGRAEGLQQGAHDLAQYLSGTYHRPAITTNPLGDNSCIKCHQDVLTRTPRGERALSLLPARMASDGRACRALYVVSRRAYTGTGESAIHGAGPSRSRV